MLPSASDVTHLYRALLRQSSYLPLPQAREYIRGHVIFSFRNYIPKHGTPQQQNSLKRQVALLRRGRGFLSVLERANSGYLKPLERILLLTYGRAGKRRRELMLPILHDSDLTDHASVAAYNPPSFDRSFQLPPKMYALAKSQRVHAQKLGMIRRKFGQTHPEKVAIPETNIIGKPLHPSRVRNMAYRWYVENAGLVLPPLPFHEHQKLYDLVHKDMTNWVSVRARRSAVRPEDRDDSHSLSIINGPNVVQRPGYFVRDSPHHITGRLVQRALKNVLDLCPVLSWNCKTLRWDVKWNFEEVSQPSKIITRKLDDEQHRWLFKGVRSTRSSLIEVLPAGRKDDGYK